MANDNRKITDPAGVLVNGKRYPVNTLLSDIEGATTAQIKVWTRFGQLGKADAEEEAPGSKKEGGKK